MACTAPASHLQAASAPAATWPHCPSPAPPPPPYLRSYAALGSGTPGQVLNGFPDAPTWTIVVANVAVAAHMVTAIQLFAQPIYHTMENLLLVSTGWPLRCGSRAA